MDTRLLFIVVDLFLIIVLVILVVIGSRFDCLNEEVKELIKRIDKLENKKD